MANHANSEDFAVLSTVQGGSLPLNAVCAHEVLFAIGGTDFSTVTIPEAIPTGRQILVSVGLNSPEDFTLCAILPSGDFEEVSLAETFDLRTLNVERLIAFRTDRNFKLTLNGRQLIWGQPSIKGADLYRLSRTQGDQAIFQETRSGVSRLIEPNDDVNLTEAGVEHFVIASRPVKEYVIVVNSRDEPVPDERVTFEQVVNLAFPGAPVESNVRYSMTYRHAASKPHAGELAEGGSVVVKHQGTIFNVTKTVQS